MADTFTEATRGFTAMAESFVGVEVVLMFAMRAPGVNAAVWDERRRRMEGSFMVMVAMVCIYV